MPPKRKRKDGGAVGDSTSVPALTPNFKRRKEVYNVNVILGMTGSVASIKARELITKLAFLAAPRLPSLKVVATKAAKHFFNWEELKKDLSSPSVSIEFHSDEEEWRDWKKVGDPVLHIELRRWADILVIAPCSANTLAKLANGLCDDLLSCIVRAWDFKDPNKRLVIAPAMNTMMWESPFTQKHLETLVELGGGTMDDQKRVQIIGPVEKTLACGDVGNGAMASPEDIALLLGRTTVTSSRILSVSQ
jgi:phosphopantothenoylcysteine synthetase/decarboxylase